MTSQQKSIICDKIKNFMSFPEVGFTCRLVGGYFGVLRFAVQVTPRPVSLAQITIVFIQI